MKVKPFAAVMTYWRFFFCTFSAQLEDEAPLTSHLQRLAIYHSFPHGCRTSQCYSNSATKLCVCCCCCQALILNASLAQRPTSAGNKPKFMVSLSLFIIATHVSCPACFICLIQFSTANDSELEGNCRERRTKNDYWTEIPSIHLSSIVRAPCRRSAVNNTQTVDVV